MKKTKHQQTITSFQKLARIKIQKNDSLSKTFLLRSTKESLLCLITMIEYVSFLN